MNLKSLFKAGVPLAAAVAAALGASTQAPAQTAAMASSTFSTSTSSATTTTETSTLVPVQGKVLGSPETVSFTGQAVVNTKVVTDPDFGGPSTVVLSLDLSQVTGTGQSTRKKYVTSSQYVIDRRLAAADTVQVSFPFAPSGSAPGSARVGLASFNLSFNVATGQLTGATVALATP